MTESAPVVVRQFMSTIEAELAQGALEAAGIDAVVRADDAGAMHPHLQAAGVRLLVRPEDLDDAVRILDMPAEPAPDAG